MSAIGTPGGGEGSVGMGGDAGPPLETSIRWLLPLWRLDDVLARVDHVVLVAALGFSGLFATASGVLRWVGVGGSPWLDLLPRYLTLAVCMFGAALASRLGGHIALDLLGRLLPPGISRWVRVGADCIASGVAFALGVSAWRFLQVEREGGGEILHVLPSWLPILFMVWGFGIAAFRFWLRAGARWPVALPLLPALAFTLSHFFDGSAPFFMWLCATGLIVGLLIGAPLFAALGGAAALLFAVDDIDLAAVCIEVFRLTEAPTLVTLPLFTLMGSVLAKSQAPARLVRFARAWLGMMPGGLLVATVMVCAFFTTFTGASGVTILALGLLLHQLLLQEKYGDELAVGVVTASGSIGLLFAPALPLIVYGIVSKVEIDRLFIAGIVPGALLIIAVVAVGLFLARGKKLQRHSFEWSEASAAARAAAWELALPVIVLGLMLSGLATVVEASAVGVVYTIAVALWVHRDVHWRDDLPALMASSGVLIGAVLIILGVALAFTGYLVDAEVPQAVVQWARSQLSNRWAFLLAVNLLLLVVGCLLDIFSAIIIFVPLLMPVGEAFGVDPVHLGIIFLANLELGYLTPPVGMNLFLSSYRFGRPLPVIWRTTIPFLGALAVALILITYVPAISLGLLDWIGK